MHLKPEMPASMLTKVLRNEKDYEREYRGGTRGGRDLFNWEDVKVMSHKDRECYLGYSTKIGILDKGGKWKRRDWYRHVERPKAGDAARLRAVQQEDQERMEVALGLRKKEPSETEREGLPMFGQKKAEVFSKRVRSLGGGEEFNGTFGLGYRSDPLKLKDHARRQDPAKNPYRLEGTREHK